MGLPLFLSILRETTVSRSQNYWKIHELVDKLSFRPKTCHWSRVRRPRDGPYVQRKH